MRTQSRVVARSIALLFGVVLALAAGTGSVLATPGAQDRSQRDPAGIQGDRQDNKIRDYRIGRIAPTSRQRERAAEVGARALWNAFGTPAMLMSTGKPLAHGLPADPVAAARVYVAANRDLLGLTQSGAAALEILAVAPMGRGAAVLFRQRFGSLPAGVDGLLAVGVRGGAAYYVSSSLGRSSATPADATLSAAAARKIAIRDSGRSDATVMKTELVAVPTVSGARAAYLITLGADLYGAKGTPVAYATYVDARDGSILLREDLVDHDSDNPEWAVFPNTPPTDYSSTDTRVIWCATAAAGCDEVVGSPASPLSWDAFSG
ncbi:MAG TPA: hypothetical protein VFL61_10060, partial [Gaiellaceae bacterium]|nr:hypothetical protein [Gaiellaceae bacterium]